MSRLIDADAFMDVIREHEYRLATKQGSIDYGMFTLGIQQAVDEQPTIDAVPVVRCRECFGRNCWQKDENGCDICLVSGLYVRGEDDYCPYGEQKGGADNG